MIPATLWCPFPFPCVSPQVDRRILAGRKFSLSVMFPVPSTVDTWEGSGKCLGEWMSD